VIYIVDNSTRQSILGHYVSRFEKKGPEREKKRRSVGMEAKFCLTDSCGKAVSAGFLEELFTHLSNIGWDLDRDKNLGIATGATRDSDSCRAMISTGTGHSKIELSVPYAGSVGALESNFLMMVEEVKSCAVPNGMHLLCLGVHPLTSPQPGMVQKKSRHLFWDQAFKKDLVHLFTISSDCQVHVDVSTDEVHVAVKVLQGLSGPQIALTANATVWRGNVDSEYLDVREAFWDWWLEGEDRAGMTRKPFVSLDDYVDRISLMKPVFITREGESLGIYHYPSFYDYYGSGSGATAVTGDGRKVKVIPEVEDIDLHDTFNWYTTRLSHYGTVENRANCQQPPEAIMSVPALTLGLVENLDNAAEYVAGFDWELLRSLRSDSLRRGPAATAGDVRVLEMSRKMLMLADEGLVGRGQDEQGYLAPLWKRLKEQSCPALECRKIFENGGIDSLIERYSL